MNITRRHPLILALALLCGASAPAFAKSPAMTEKPSSTLRLATYNTSLYGDTDGAVIARLEAGDPAARKIAAVIQRVRPDLLLLNEFDYDAAGRQADLFQREYLEKPQAGGAPIHYAYRYLAPVNTGVPSGLDLDHDGKVGGGNDAWGFGLHPGQYGMLVLSRFPIDTAHGRTFRELRWAALPGAMKPVDPATGQPWYPDAQWRQLRLSSKSHWDVPVQSPLGTLHFLVHHPTPPVFDGPDDHNGARNHDEIRLWAEYVANEHTEWLCDDAGRCGGLPAGERFVIAGDHNADPVDGDGTGQPINQLLHHPRVLKYPAPRSEGAAAAAARVGGGNATQRGDPAEDTGEFGPKVGNLRLDYLLPSADLRVRAGGVFWPKPGEPGAEWIDASDHHLVWLDLASGSGGD
jgi:endonuclease/exonuclease/phosphatase family metal-dependent hydrolase